MRTGRPVFSAASPRNGCSDRSSFDPNPPPTADGTILFTRVVAGNTNADLFVWKNGGGDVTGARAYWRVDGGAWQELTLNWASNVPLTIPGTSSTTGGGEDQSWRTVGRQANFLAGASAGQHTLQVYFKALTNEGDRLNGSAAAPFSASFSVSAVPEPTTSALWVAGLAAVGLGAARRRLR